MTFDIITLFPEMFGGLFDRSIIGRAIGQNLVSVRLHQLRDFAVDHRGSVDDRPFGGGAGMILRIEPIYRALDKIKNPGEKIKSRTVLLDPRGTIFTQAKAREYARLDQLVLICGRYEGVDERVREHLVDESISLGGFVLTGGEIPAAAIVDSVTRLIGGVLPKPEATQIESFSRSPTELEFPQYTRPEDFLGWRVPPVLLSGNHRKIDQWRTKSQETQKN